jgi:hypothetical protein
MNEPPPILPVAPHDTGIVKWHGNTVHVEARQVPRYLLTTTSIDVYLDGQCILQTGGRLNPTGSCVTTFNHGGSAHEAELSWGMALWYSFPYQLRIDGIPIAISQIRARNWYWGFMVASLIGIVFGVILFFLFKQIRRSISL